MVFSSFNVTCIDVAAIDYEVSVIGLLHEIDPLKSLIKVFNFIVFINLYNAYDLRLKMIVC